MEKHEFRDRHESRPQTLVAFLAHQDSNEGTAFYLWKDF